MVSLERRGGHFVGAPSCSPGSRMAAPQPCVDGSCSSHPGAVPGVQQTLEEMDFERGERGEAAAWPAAGNPQPHLSGNED